MGDDIKDGLDDADGLFVTLEISILKIDFIY